MAKKYQVFISSTFRDLIDERQDAIRSVLDLGHIPSGMEAFPAADIEQFEYIKKVIDECDYYILLIGARYGSVDEVGVSFTEKEYDYAVEQKKTVLAFVHRAISSIPAAKSDTDAALIERLSRFRTKVSRGRLVQFWLAQDDLKGKVIVSLVRATSDAPAVGWVRANLAGSAELLDQINKLRNENDELKRDLEEAKKALPSPIERAIDFNKIFKLRVNYAPPGNNSTYVSSGVLELSWREIFLAVGPALVTAQPESIIFEKLRCFLVEKNNVLNVELATKTDLQLIKFQLIAYRLVDSHLAPSEQGKMENSIVLTDEGRRQLLEQTIEYNQSQ